MGCRLAAILAADVVGYSLLMNNDEKGTLTTLKQCEFESIDPKVKSNNGRIFKGMEDGNLM
jgi:class 3 adenylate cyclase